MNKQDATTKYIRDQLKAKQSPQAIIQNLVTSGWQEAEAAKVVNAVAAVPPPPPSQGVANNTAQTGNEGKPLQVEGVQYNMMMSPVESRVGFFLRLASVGLWFTVFFLGFTLAALIAAAQGDSEDVAGLVVFTISLSFASVPVFLIANSKMHKELDKNPAFVDDLFYKKSTRSGLYAAVVLTAIALIAAVFNLLGAAFLDDAGSISGFFQSVGFLIPFTGALYYFWQLHAKTRR
ncbi:MAG: hypothetical protein AAF413_03045 [Patescibacteria group bacterium]